jgi:hypothetical protein
MALPEIAERSPPLWRKRQVSRPFPNEDIRIQNYCDLPPGLRGLCRRSANHASFPFVTFLQQSRPEEINFL